MVYSFVIFIIYAFSIVVIKMKRKTKLMRVPDDFFYTVDSLSKKHGQSRTCFLKEEGVRLFKNADLLTDMFGGLFSKKKKK